MIRVEAPSSEGARVLGCLLPGKFGGVVAASLMAKRTAASPGCLARTALPNRPARLVFRREGRLQPATVAIRLVAESSDLRSRTFSRVLR
jgi:hypothetical protein